MHPCIGAPTDRPNRVADSAANIRRYLLGVALTDQLGADWVEQRQETLRGLYPEFDDVLATAIASNRNAEIAALLDDLRAQADVFIEDTKFVADRWDDFQSSDPAEVAAVKGAFDELDVAFANMQRDLSDATELIETRARNAEQAANDASSLMIELVVAAALIALGVFGYVWRRVLKAADQMNAMQAEVARTAAMVEGSPTATIFADPISWCATPTPSAAPPCAATSASSRCNRTS